MNNGDMWLVYEDESGEKHYQHWRDLVMSGSLIDPDTGDDMDLIGWAGPDYEDE